MYSEQEIKEIFRNKLTNNEFKFDKRTNQKFIEIINANFIANSQWIVYHNHITPPTLQWYEDFYMPLVGDQVDKVVNLIKNDYDTRQAYIGMIVPKRYHEGDMTCTIGMQAIYRSKDNKLDYIVYMRSNNVCQFTQDYKWQLSIWLDIIHKLEQELNHEINLGTMYWNVGSLHIYEEDFKFLSDDTKIAKALIELEKM